MHNDIEQLDAPKVSGTSDDLFDTPQLLSAARSFERSTYALTNLPELALVGISFEQPDASLQLKNVGKALENLSEQEHKNGLKVTQKENGSYDLRGAGFVETTIYPDGTMTRFDKVKGSASTDKDGTLVVKEGESTIKIYKNGSVEKSYTTEYGDEDDVPVTETFHGHGQYKTKQVHLKDRTETTDSYPSVPKMPIKIDDKTSIQFSPEKGSISITNGTTTWTADANGDLQISKDGKTDTYKALDAKFTPSGLRCGGGTFTFEDGTKIFFKSGKVVSLTLQNSHGETLGGAYPLTSSKQVVVTATKKK